MPASAASDDGREREERRRAIDAGLGHGPRHEAEYADRGEHHHPLRHAHHDLPETPVQNRNSGSA